MKLGQDPYNPDLDAVEESLIQLKPNVKTYWGTYDDFVKAYTAGDIVIGNVWGSIATQLKAEGITSSMFILKRVQWAGQITGAWCREARKRNWR